MLNLALVSSVKYSADNILGLDSNVSLWHSHTITCSNFRFISSRTCLSRNSVAWTLNPERQSRDFNLGAAHFSPHVFILSACFLDTVVHCSTSNGTEPTLFGWNISSRVSPKIHSNMITDIGKANKYTSMWLANPETKIRARQTNISSTTLHHNPRWSRCHFNPTLVATIILK